jgi:hypothetical protein
MDMDGCDIVLTASEELLDVDIHPHHLPIFLCSEPLPSYPFPKFQ